MIAQGFGKEGPEGEISDDQIFPGHDDPIAENFSTLKAIPKRTYMLGADGISWTELPKVDEAVLAKVAEHKASLRAAGKTFEPLNGDPAYVFKYNVTVPPAEEGAEPTTEEKELPELERLAAMVEEIEFATAVVPVGAFVLTSKQSVVANKFYRGLPLSDGLSLRSYQHLRTPQRTAPAEISTMSKSKEFLDTVADDTPRDSWSLKHDPSNNLVVLRSLEYPGYVHFQMVDNPTYGSAYVGTGYKNEDLVHML